MNRKYVITFEFTRKKLEIRNALFDVTLDDRHDLDSCVLHLRKDYERYVFFLRAVLKKYHLFYALGSVAKDAFLTFINLEKLY